MVYLTPEFLHQAGSAALAVVIAVIVLLMAVGYRARDAAAVAATAGRLLLADALLVAVAVLLLPATGALLAWEAGYALTEGWIVVSIMAYLVAGAFWLPVVWVHWRMRRLAVLAAREERSLPALYRRLFAISFALGLPAFAAVAAIFWLMIARPAITLW